MYKIASAFATSRHISLQEAVALTLPELWLRKCFPKTVFISTNIPTERVKFCKSEKEIRELNPDSTDVFKRNMIDRYIDRPDKNFRNGKFSVVDDICLAVFVSNYYIDYKNENDSQPEILSEDLPDLQPTIVSNFPPVIPLMSNSEKLKCRQVRQILRYHIPNSELNPEKFAHYLLFLFYPFRREENLRLNDSYCQKLAQKGVTDIINSNKQIFEPYADNIDKAFSTYINNQQCCNNTDFDIEPTVTEQLIEDNYQEPVLFNNYPQSLTQPLQFINDESLFEMIRSLNCEQRHVFNILYSWSRTKVKYRNSLYRNDVKPIHLFVSGGAGVGKSYLIKIIYEAISKNLSFLLHLNRNVFFCFLLIEPSNQ